jgi:tetratricopeptide (TPR) repeat protein
MRPRPAWLLLPWLLCLGCHSLVGLDLDADPPDAEALWDQGQAAMKDGNAARAIGFYEQSLAADPNLTRNHMSLAAALLEKGDDAGAAEHLARYLAAHPEHLVVRSHYAELLLRLRRVGEAHAEYEHFLADAQEQAGVGVAQLVQAHTRLMDIAEAGDDEYERHLHRGIGLYWLALQRAGRPDPQGELSVEGLLCKAAGELTMARRRRPDEARPQWYLHNVWARLGQQQPAQRWLRAARAAAPYTYLTPAEQRQLQLACAAADGPARK